MIFSGAGAGEKLRAAWQPGDAMLIVPTLGNEVEENERGRVLGYQEFTGVAGTTREVVDPTVLARTGDR